MVKAIIFDLGNVLIHFDAKRAAKRFARQAHVPYKKVWRHFFTSRVEKAYTRGEISSLEFFRHARETFNSKIDYATFKKLWNEIFWPNEGAVRILKRLNRHYPLYLISNTNALHFNYVRRQFPKVFKHFRRTFPSHEVGRRKPDPRIYWKVLRSICLVPEEALFIDDMPKFVEAARKIGMKGICFRSNGQLRKELRRLGVKL